MTISRKRWRRSVLTPCIVVFAAFIAGCDRKPPATGDLIRPVKTMVIGAGADTRTRTFPGKIEASKRVELSFQVPGLLVKLPAREGQKVTKGELIAQLRQDEFQARLTSLKGELDKARALLRALQSGDRPEEQLRLEGNVRAAAARMANAKSEYDRATRLLPKKAVAVADFERARTTYEVSKEDHKAALQLLEQGTIARQEDIDAKAGVVRSLEGQVVGAKIQLDDTTLKAPFDGVIAKRFVEENQNIRAGEPVVQFQDIDEIEVAVDVPETVMVSDIRTADIVQMTAEVNAAPGLMFPVQIKEIAKAADPVTQTFRIRVGMPAPASGLTLLPGMTATVTVQYRRAAVLGTPITVPISALYKGGKGEEIVWIVGPDLTVARRVVKSGAATGGQVEILEGLQPGDRIAVAGAHLLREGQRVRDLGDALSAPSAATPANGKAGGGKS